MKKPGRKPFGATKKEAEVVKRIRLLARRRRDGSEPGASQIARELNDKGIKTRCGGLWTARQVINVLKGPKSNGKKYPKKDDLGPDDYLTPEETAKAIVKLTDYGDEILLILFLLGVNTGLRVSEMAALQLRDLPRAPDRHRIWVRRGKRFKARSVDVDPRFTLDVTRYLKAHRRGVKRTDEFLGVSTRTIQRKIKEIGKIIGRLELKTHALRHTFATLLYFYTKDRFYVRDQLGHSSDRATEIYVKVLSESKKANIRAFGDGLAGAVARIWYGECRSFDVKRQSYFKFKEDKRLET